MSDCRPQQLTMHALCTAALLRPSYLLQQACRSLHNRLCSKGYLQRPEQRAAHLLLMFVVLNVSPMTEYMDCCRTFLTAGRLMAGCLCLKAPDHAGHNTCRLPRPPTPVYATPNRPAGSKAVAAWSPAHLATTRYRCYRQTTSINPCLLCNST